ncbi:hypothetical protein MTO96_023209 [Rhipicephalus appendiculatus]
MVRCPFDTSHLIPASVRAAHVRHCPRKRNGATARRYHRAELPMEENWEPEIVPGRAGYVPPVNLNFPVFREVQSLTPRQRRDYYSDLLRQHKLAEENNGASQRHGDSEETEESTISSTSTPSTPTDLSQSSTEDLDCQTDELLPVTPDQPVSVNVNTANTVASNMPESAIEPVPNLPASATVLTGDTAGTHGLARTEPDGARKLDVASKSTAEHAQLPEPEKLSELAETQTPNDTPPGNLLPELPAPAKLLVPAKPRVSANVPLANKPEPAHDSAPAKRVVPVKIQPRVSLVASANLPKPRNVQTPNMPAPAKHQVRVRLAAPASMPKPENMPAANIKAPAKLQARISLAAPTNLSIPESASAPDSKAPAKLQPRVSLAAPTKNSKPGNMATPIVKAPAKIKARVSLAAPANLPKSENLHAANIKSRSNLQTYITLRAPNWHKPANAPTPSIPDVPERSSSEH